MRLLVSRASTVLPLALHTCVCICLAYPFFASRTLPVQDSCSTHTLLLRQCAPSARCFWRHCDRRWWWDTATCRRSGGGGCKLGHNTGCGNVQYELQSTVKLKCPPMAAELKKEGGIMNMCVVGRGFKQIWTVNPDPQVRSTRGGAATPRRGLRMGGSRRRATPRGRSCRRPGRTGGRSTTWPQVLRAAADGYHVILSVWEVLDTPLGFYNVIDATQF